MQHDTFISIHNITIRNGDRFFFEHSSWKINKHEQWLIYGPNGSGKSTLAKAIAGLLPTKQGEIILHFVGKKDNPFPSVHRQAITYMSFETEQSYFLQEEKIRDFKSHLKSEGKSTTVSAYMKKRVPKKYQSIFNIEHLLSREISSLSSGEMRKISLIKACIDDPKLLILDEPFTGLDKQSKKHFLVFLEQLIQNSIHLLLIVHSTDEIPSNITHILLLKNCHIFAQGEKALIYRLHNREFTYPSIPQQKTVTLPYLLPIDRFKKPLVTMKNVTVTYGKNTILDQINWTWWPDENWMVSGPNGAGKSTLVQLIYGDQLQSYANDISICGIRRDSTIPIGEIKKHIGILTPSLHLRYTANVISYHVLLSGFFDSIGLYASVTPEQERQAKTWIDTLGIQDILTKKFHRLSFGQQRLILLARALVTNPKILLLDEPFVGLDSDTRTYIRDCINVIGNSDTTKILLISHTTDDLLSCIRNILYLDHGRIREIKRISYRS